MDQSQSLSQALQGHTAEPNTYSDLQEWLAPSTTASTSDPCAESATSAGMAIVTWPFLPLLSASLLPPLTVEFDQFLQQRSQQAESLPPARHRAQMQQKDDQPEELFAL